jgi:hypothetical protein
MSENTKTETPVQVAPTTTTQPMSRAQGFILILLLLIGFGFPLFAFFQPIGRWEYKVVEFAPKPQFAFGTAGRSGVDALQPATIQIDAARLQSLGDDGWELVSSFLEMETAFPNFGNDDFVTGLRENVRPQKATFIFKRRARWF